MTPLWPLYPPLPKKPPVTLPNQTPFNEPSSATQPGAAARSGLCLDGEFPGWVQTFLSLLLLGLQVLLVLVQPAPHGPSLLGPQIQGFVLLALLAKTHSSRVQTLLRAELLPQHQHPWSSLFPLGLLLEPASSGDSAGKHEWIVTFAAALTQV